jgi:hypothetical protein
MAIDAEKIITANFSVEGSNRFYRVGDISDIIAHIVFPLMDDEKALDQIAEEYLDDEMIHLTKPAPEYVAVQRVIIVAIAKAKIHNSLRKKEIHAYDPNQGTQKTIVTETSILWNALETFLVPETEVEEFIQQKYNRLATSLQQKRTEALPTDIDKDIVEFSKWLQVVRSETFPTKRIYDAKMEIAVDEIKKHKGDCPIFKGEISGKIASVIFIMIKPVDHNPRRNRTT